MSCSQSFTTEEILSNHKKQCLLIKGCQAVSYEKGIIKFTNHNKQISILFKTYPDTDSIGAKLVYIDDRFTFPSIISKRKDCINQFITRVLNNQK